MKELLITVSQNNVLKIKRSCSMIKVNDVKFLFPLVLGIYLLPSFIPFEDGALTAQAQFKKYKSKTEFAAPSKTSTSTESSKLNAAGGMVPSPSTSSPSSTSSASTFDSAEDQGLDQRSPKVNRKNGFYSENNFKSNNSLGEDDEFEANNDNNGGFGDSDDEDGDSGGSGSQGGIRGNKDYFGRGTGISKSQASAAGSKGFVNLNPETAFGPEVITSFDFPNVDILDLTKHMQKLTGINLIYEKDMKGKISIVAPSPITVGDAWKAYLIALNTHNYSIQKSGAFYKIVQTRNIRNTPPKIYMGSYTPNTENYVMRIISLKNVGSAEISRNFRQFMSQFGRIIEIRQTNTVILQDTGANINRLVKLIKFLDVPGYEESLQIIKVENSSAQEIAGLLDKILRGQGGGGSRFQGGDLPAGGRPQAYDVSKIIAEPRTNSIIAMTTAEGAKQLKELIKKLDVKLVSKGSGQIHVYYLNYGDADTLAKTLSSLVSSTGTTSYNRFGPRPAGEPTPLFASAVKITADKANNALVVMASPTDYLTIKNIIAKLDIPRDQVYVEGLIMEAQVNSGTDFGISILGAYGSGGGERFGSMPGGGGNQDLLSLLTNNIANLSGMFVGLGGGRTVETTVNGTKYQVKSVNGLIKAIASDSSTNVLATPQILALDNEDAVFEAGETVPTLIRETAANGSTTTSVKEQKIALTLKITPQINKVTHMIKLKINQKIDDFSGRQTGISEGVGTTTRQAVTTVLVRDKDTIAMGGLMRDKNLERESKVPLLGDIPVLGWLFKQKSKTTEKVNLLFFLTPRILAPYEKGAAETTKDVLNRRNAHLKKVYDDDNDPFRSTVKSLYKKVDNQEKAPLYDAETSAKFLKENNQGGSLLRDNRDENEENEKIDGSKVDDSSINENDKINSKIEVDQEIKSEPANANAKSSHEEDIQTKLAAPKALLDDPSLDPEADIPNYQKIVEEVKKDKGKEKEKEKEKNQKVEAQKTGTDL